MQPQNEKTRKFADFMATIVKPAGTDSPPRLPRGSTAAMDPPDPDRVCSDGERTAHLTRLAGSWIQRGYRIEDVLRLAHDWNNRNTPPLEGDKVASTCYGILSTHQNNHGILNPDEKLLPLFDLKEASIARYLDNPPPSRTWLLRDCLPMGKLGLIVARGGTGKSQFLLQLAISAATGEKLAGHWDIDSPGEVLVLFAEDDNEEIHRRLSVCVGAMSMNQLDHPEFFRKLQKNLHIKSMVAARNVMTSKAKNGDTVQTKYVERLLMTMQDIPNCKLVIVDPASRFRSGEENSAEEATRFVEVLEVLSQSSAATVLVAHHVRKSSGSGGDNAQDASRGSSALTDGVRWQMNMTTFSEKEARKHGIPVEQRRSYVTVEITKNNYAPPQEEIILKRGDGGYLHCVQLPSPEIAKTDDAIRKIIALITSEEAAGRKYSKASFEKGFGGVENKLGLSNGAVRKVLTEAVSTGRLTTLKGKLSAKRAGMTAPAKLPIKPNTSTS